MNLNHKMVYKKTVGQSLVEVIVALGIVVILAISLVTASMVTQKTSRAAKNNTQATKLVQENLEQIRVFRDRKGYAELTDRTCSYLTYSDPDPGNWTLSACISVPPPELIQGEIITMNNTRFERRIAIAIDTTYPLYPKKLVTVTVNWQESGANRFVSGYTYLAPSL